MKSFNYQIIKLLLTFLLVFNSLFAPRQLYAEIETFPTVLISEIMWAGSSHSNSDEWIELFNYGSEVVDLADFMITGAASGGEDLVFNEKCEAQNLEINPGEYWLISNYIDTDDRSALAIVPDCVTSSVSLSNAELSLTLMRGEIFIDMAGEDGEAPFAGQSGDLKASMERTLWWDEANETWFFEDGGEVEAWYSATESFNLKDASIERATPGATGSNATPVVVFDLNVEEEVEVIRGEALEIDLSGSYDPLGEALEVEWWCGDSQLSRESQISPVERASSLQSEAIVDDYHPQSMDGVVECVFDTAGESVVDIIVRDDVHELEYEIAVRIENPVEEIVEVTEVIDGDTIEVVNELGQSFKVRYIGLDAPELAHGYEEMEMWAEEATIFNEELVLGETVRLVRDVSDVDVYGRLLRYVYLTDDALVNEEILRAGWAETLNIAPDSTYSEDFSQAQALAQQNYLGIWWDAEVAALENRQDLWQQLQLSEVYPRPGGDDDEFIEIYNPADVTIDLRDLLVCDKAKCYEVTEEDFPNFKVESGGYFTFPRAKTGLALNDTGLEEISLQLEPVVGGQNQTLQAVTYESAQKGQSWAWDGQAWRWTDLVTIEAANEFSLLVEDIVVETEETGSKSQGGSDQVLGEDYTHWIDKVVISEILPNLDGVDDDEWVELQNISDQTVDLGGWWLNDKEIQADPAKNKRGFEIPIGTVLNPGGFITYHRPDTKISLGNAADRVGLYAPDGTRIDFVDYSKAPEETSWARKPDGTYAWTVALTPGESNVLVGSIDVDEKTSASAKQESAPTEYQTMSIGAVKSQSKGTKVSVSGWLLVDPGIYSSRTSYLGDETGQGIQLYSSKGWPDGLTAGVMMEIEGRLSESKGEKRILVDQITKTDSTTQAPSSQTKLLGELDASLVGSLVTVNAEMADTERSKWYLENEDGESLLVTFKQNSPIKVPDWEIGSQVEVTGILVSSSGEYELWPRVEADLRLLEAVAGIGLEADESVAVVITWWQDWSAWMVAGLVLFGLLLTRAWYDRQQQREKQHV